VNGYVIVGKFGDDGFSGSKRNRGPDLEAAIAAAVAAAAEHGDCALMANTSARFGRGTSRRGEARALGQLYYEMRQQGVALRAVVDDEMLSEMLIGIGSTIASKYSSDLGESIRRARLREFNNGVFTGGAPRDGYRIVRVNDDEGRVVGREIVLDAPRADLWRRIFAMAREGVSDGRIARHLNAEGARTKSGRYFDRRAIGDGLACQFYAGRLVRNVRKPGELIVVEGRHPALIPPAEFDALQRQRSTRRDDAPLGRSGRRTGAGRPARNHALAGLARCACGQPMAAVVSNYVRKDGTRRRIYQCRSGMSGAGNCGAPCVSAELIDGEIVAALDRLLIDFDGWRDRIERGRSVERDRLTRELDRAERDHAAQAKRHEAVSAKWAEFLAAGDDTTAALVLPIVAHEREALTQAERRLTATHDALDSIPDQVDGDALLDFGAALRAAVRGRLDAGNGSMAAVNAALRELFECFAIHERDEKRLQPTEPGYVEFVPTGRRQVVVQPILLASVAESLQWQVQARSEGLLCAGDDGAPPLRWLTVPAEHVDGLSDQVHPVRVQISLYDRPSARSTSAVTSCGFSRCSASAA
jgi:hypothetical protein